MRRHGAAVRSVRRSACKPMSASAASARAGRSAARQDTASPKAVHLPLDNPRRLGVRQLSVLRDGRLRSKASAEAPGQSARHRPRLRPRRHPALSRAGGASAPQRRSRLQCSADRVKSEEQGAHRQLAGPRLAAGAHPALVRLLAHRHHVVRAAAARARELQRPSRMRRAGCWRWVAGRACAAAALPPRPCRTAGQGPPTGRP